VKPLTKNTWLRQYGLLILAALFFSSSFFFSRIYSGRSSVVREAKLDEQYISSKIQPAFTGW
jgi:hypothetical protein